ncbi:MAG TPA: hypothetical protein VEO56_01950 [Bacteroidota bacterium]|nr:hypothetical protein [Bacteroidota bacterium]
MKKPVLLWFTAFVVTAASAYVQRVTGPTYPLRGELVLGTLSIPYRLERSHSGSSEALISIRVRDSSVIGVVRWRRLNSNDAWMFVPMSREGDLLIAGVPGQPPSGKISYSVFLKRDSEEAAIPPDAPAVMRFKGEVPALVLWTHIFMMFLAMMLSTRTGLEVFTEGRALKGLTYGTVAFLAVGGMILGPVVQKYAFGAYWTGWPFGSDLTDNKTLLVFVAWIAVASALKRSKRIRFWALAAALVTLAVYMVPHSLLGSEMDFRKGADKKAAPSLALFVAPKQLDICQRLD